MGCQKSAWPVSYSDGPGPAVVRVATTPILVSFSARCRPQDKRKVGGSTPPLTTHEVFTFQWGLFSRFGVTFRYALWRGRGCCPVRVRFVPAWRLSVLRGRVPGTLAVIAVLVMGAVAWCRLARWSGRSGGEAGEGPAAPAPGFRGQALGGAALVFFLPGVPGLQDALVADDEQAGDGGGYLYSP